MASRKPLVKFGLLGLLFILFVTVNAAGHVYGQENRQALIASNKSIQKYIKRFTFPTGLKTSLIEFDPQGQMWVHGIFPPSEQVVYVYRNGGLVKEFTGGQYPGHVLDFAFDKQGHVWAATLTNGLAYLMDEKWEYITLPSVSNMIMNITTIETDAQGNLWVGTQGAGIFVWNGKEWTNHKVDTTRMAGGFINGIAFDSQGGVWVATSEGASLFDGKEWTKYTPENSGLATPHINAVAVDDGDRAWFATKKGVYVFDGSTWKKYGDEDQNVIVADRQGQVWVGLPNAPERTAVIVNDEYKRLTSVPMVVPAALAPDAWIWSNEGVSYSADIPLESESSELVQFGRVISSTRLAISMVLILLAIGVGMEMWRVTGISLGIGVLVFTAGFLTLTLLFGGLPGMKVQSGAAASILAAGAFALGMTAGFFRLRYRQSEGDKPQNHRLGTALTFVSLLIFISMICACISTGLPR